MKLPQVVEQTALATGAAEKIVSLLGSEDDVNYWEIISGSPLHFKRKMEVPERFWSLILKAKRDLFSDKTYVPTVDFVFVKLTQIRVIDVIHMSLFEGGEFPKPRTIVWTCFRSILY